MKRVAIPILAAAVVAAALWAAAAQGQDKTPYTFKLGDEITATAAEVVIEPRWRGLVDDKFAYEAYANSYRRGMSSEGEMPFDSFQRRENWIAYFTLTAQEDELEGRKDLRLAMQFDQLDFLVDNGRARYAGYIGPAQGDRTAGFREIMPDGKRNSVVNIPGWAGVNASSVESQRAAQAGLSAATAWVSIDENGRLYNEAFYADYSNADQRNQPGRLIDPMHLLLGMCAQFPEGTKLKIGETVEVTRRFPVGAMHGATLPYRITYKLDKLYGTVEEPTAARFSFTAVPLAAEQTARSNGLDVRFTAPEISDGSMLFELAKGIPVDVTWKYALKGTASQGDLRTEFSVDTDYRATLRTRKDSGDEGEKK